MEPNAPLSDTPAFEVVGEERPAAVRDDLRTLHRLRDRIEAAAAELERLRAENAALAARVAALEAGDGGGGALPFDLSLPGSADELRTRLDGFIAAIDQALREAAPTEDAPGARPLPPAP